MSRKNSADARQPINNGMLGNNILPISKLNDRD